MTRLASILPHSAEDLTVGSKMLALRQPERRAVTEIARVAKPMSGLSMVLLGGDEVVHSTVTSSQADDLYDLLSDVSTQVERMKPMVGVLDGMRFSRQMFFLQLESGPDRQGLIDEDLIETAKSLLDQRVVATLERIVEVRADGKRGRASYRLVDVRAAQTEGTIF